MGQAQRGTALPLPTVRLMDGGSFVKHERGKVTSVPPCIPLPAHFLRERMPGTSETSPILGPAWHDVRRVWGQGSLLGPISRMRSSEKVCKHWAKLCSDRTGFGYSSLARAPALGVRGGRGPSDLADAPRVGPESVPPLCMDCWELLEVPRSK